jgi:hypothetical protein
MSEATAPVGAAASGSTPVKKEGALAKPWHKKGPRSPPTSVKFEGRCEAIKKHVFDCSSTHNADQFMQTQRELAEHMGGTVLKFGGGDIRLTVEKLERRVFAYPANPDANATPVELARFQLAVKAVSKKEEYYEENLRTLYTIAWGQCSPALREKLKMLDNYTAMSDELDGLALLVAVKTNAYNFESFKFLPLAVYENMYPKGLCKQDEGMSNRGKRWKFWPLPRYLRDASERTRKHRL